MVKNGFFFFFFSQTTARREVSVAGPSGLDPPTRWAPGSPGPPRRHVSQRSWKTLTTECVVLNRTCCAVLGALVLLLVSAANLALELVHRWDPGQNGTQVTAEESATRQWLRRVLDKVLTTVTTQVAAAVAATVAANDTRTDA